MDYKSYFEKFVEDFYKRFDEDEERRKAFREITDNYKRTQDKLSEISKALNKPETKKPIEIIDNPKFMELMGISQKTAQAWRDKGTISYSQVGNKIYYRISDIKELLERFHIKAIRKEIDND